MRARVALIIFLATTLLVAGCTQEQESGPEDVVISFYQELTGDDPDYDMLYRQIAPSVRQDELGSSQEWSSSIQQRRMAFARSGMEVEFRGIVNSSVETGSATFYVTYAFTVAGSEETQTMKIELVRQEDTWLFREFYNPYSDGTI